MKPSLFATTLLLALTAAQAHASPTKGTMVAFPVVQHGTAVMFSGLEFRGKEVTDVFASAQGGNIDCAIFNDRGALVAKDEGPTNACRIKVTPKQAGKCTVLVTNVATAGEAKVTLTIQ